MGLMDKLKNILFEEEEVEIPVIEKKSKKIKKTNEDEYDRFVPEVEEKTPDYNHFYDDLEPVVAEERKQEEKHEREEVSEREIFKSEKTFNFPAFDEEEFEQALPPKRATNVLEFERQKEDYRKYEPKTETNKEVKKFKPSPIISPVYGILDKNYTPDEITSRNNPTPPKALDVESVRKKAFGILEEEKPEVVEVDNILDEEDDSKVLEEKMEKARTIDELLKDSSDDAIDVSLDTMETAIITDEDLEEVKQIEEKEDELESLDEVVPPKEEKLEDTLESDLFDLIDSMYENREDGE